MAPRSGLSAQIGYGDETTPGTAVAPTLFLPLVSESLVQERERLESEGIIAGRRTLDSEQWNGGPITVSGDVAHELYATGLGKLFKHMFGAVDTTGTGPYTHVFTPGDLDGKALTVQVGRPGVAGAVHPFVYAGCKVTSWEIACTVGEIATIGLSLVGMSEATGGSLASASYGPVKPLKFNHGSVLVDGAPVKVKQVTISGENGLDADRRFIGQQGIDEPLEAELRTYEGSLETEFRDLTQYQRFVDGAEFPMVLAFAAAGMSVTIETNIRYDGETPNVGGREILTQNLPFKCIGDGSDADAIKATLVNAEATV